MDTMKQDVLFALRQVCRTPMVSLFIIATLAVGIGITAAIFSTVDTLLLRPIYHAEHELVQLNGAYRNRGDAWSVSLPNAADWAIRSRSFSSFAWYQRVSMTLTDDGSADRIQTVTSTPSLFRVLDVTPLIGRLIASARRSAPIARMIMEEGAHLVVMGLAIGLGGAFLAARVMRSLLHGVSPTDPVALGLTVAVLLAVRALGSLAPALRASLIQPTDALRSQ